jgi:hypothetical protein
VLGENVRDMRQLLNINFKKVSFTLLSALAINSISNITNSQEAFAIILSLPPSSFSITSGTGDNNVAPNTPINQAIFGPPPTLTSSRSSPDGFGNGTTNGFFNDTFLLLGARAIDLTIPTDFNRIVNSSAQTTVPFPLTLGDISSGLRIRYNYAFNGNSTGDSNFNDQDNFGIFLINNASPLQGTGSFITLAAPGGYSRLNNVESVLTPSPAAPLQPGNYFLRITVNENNDPFSNSSAAGFNNIIIESVPFEYSQELGLFAVGGLFGAYKLRQRSKTKKNIEPETKD